MALVPPRLPTGQGTFTGSRYMQLRSQFARVCCPVRCLPAFRVCNAAFTGSNQDTGKAC